MATSTYIGTELDVFGQARNWKGYVRDLIAPYLRGDVLEVGGGIGETCAALRSDAQRSWTALEPDLGLAARLKTRASALQHPVRVVAGSLSAIQPAPRFDCVIYIDVLEHIDRDRDELSHAVMRLRPGGWLVVLSPAHQALFTPFDAAVGHHRRYDRRQLESLTPSGTSLTIIQYVDSVGLALTIGNKLFLRSASPTLAQVLFWDRRCVPLARRVDPIFGGRLGKSILAVWRRE